MVKGKKEIRENPKNIWSKARSAIILGINYGPYYNTLEELKENKKAYISIYARRNDYHKVIKRNLKYWEDLFRA